MASRNVFTSLAFLAAFASAHADRNVLTLSNGWFFHKGEATADADTRNWMPVVVPHSYNVEDGADGGKYYRGPAWYVRSFEVNRVRDRRIYLRFGAATTVADVYVNGTRVGGHRGGFGAFCFDVTEVVHSGLNRLMVRVENTHDRNLTPLSGDFTVYGGLTRDVELIDGPTLGVSLLDDAGPGIYWTPKPVGDGYDVDVRTLLRNVGSAESAVVRLTVRDGRNRVVATSDTPAIVASGASTEAHSQLHVARPHLWNGVKDPYLYCGIVEVVVKGQVVDRVEQTIGFRSFSIDQKQGLLLNGRRYDYHGVNIHQGRPSAGWASTRPMMEQDYGLVKEIGATGVRMAHYQHSPYEHDLCDRIGLVTWAELALVNQMTETSEFEDNARNQLRELIKQNYNHPSILVWSLYNEPWTDAKHPNQWKLVQRLAAEAHRLDSTRPTTGAAFLDGRNPLNWYIDTVAFNRYWGWYNWTPNDWAKNIEGLRKETTGRSFGIGEYGAGASIVQHEWPVKQPQPYGKWHPEEWQSELHETVWPYLAKQDWMWCKLIWVMFDFMADDRNEGDHAGMNDKGLVTGDRMVKKDAFYYYKSQWSSEPVLHINSRRWGPRPAGLTDVKVYSNLPEVELFLNGKTLGKQKSATKVFLWKNVLLTDGVDVVLATGKSGRKTITDEVEF